MLGISFATLAESQATVVFEAGQLGYHTFRIPAMVVAGSGDILAFAEARKTSAHDNGEIDLVLRRSTDQGVTWGDLQIVGSLAGHTYGNPTPIVDKDGTIHLLATSNHAEDSKHPIREGKSRDIRRVHYQRSDDHGWTWTPPREITQEVTTPGADWRWYATGPGHGIQLTQGPHAGRLLAPANHSDHDRSADSPHEARNASHVLISDDHGKTWRVGGKVPTTGPNVRPWEATLAQRPDGRVLLNARNQPVDHAPRVQAISEDGGETFAEPYLVPELIEPRESGIGCQGALLRVGDMLLLSNPADTERRRRLTVRLSKDNAQTWSEGIVVWEHAAGYSDLALLSNGTIGVLYENGEENYRHRITFKTLQRPQPQTQPANE